MLTNKNQELHENVQKFGFTSKILKYLDLFEKCLDIWIYMGKFGFKFFRVSATILRNIAFLPILNSDPFDLGQSNFRPVTRQIR